MDTQVEQIYEEFLTVDDIINDRISKGVASNEKPFYIANMHDIYKKHAQWISLLPRIKPFYAVKCNNLPEIVSFLSLLGTGFDCASKSEIDQIIALGVKPSDIIYANPCKTRMFIKHARSVGVDMMTFDNELELHKIAATHPNARLILRIKGEDGSSVCKLNSKFGTDLDKCERLFELASELKLSVIGVSFHNGSGCEDSRAYGNIIASCKRVFEYGAMHGHSMYLLDIGGGFPGHMTKSGLTFQDFANSINKAISKYFPEVDPLTGLKTNYQIIAEPGRYYVASALTFVGMVIAKRSECDDKNGNSSYSYYLNDGVYGAFNNVIYDCACPVPQLLKNSTKKNQRLHSTTMWGPTCDSIDCIRRDFLFPELDVGDWIMFKNMGAYTCSAASNFNGFEKAAVIVAI